MSEKRSGSIIGYLVGVCLTLTMVFLAFFDPAPLRFVELKLLDARFSLRGTKTHDQVVSIVSIDDKSLSKVGKWPWKRTVFADLVTILKNAGAKVTAIDVYFQKNAGEEDSAEDIQLAEAVAKAGNVVLPIYLNLNKAEKAFSEDLPGGGIFTFGRTENMSFLIRNNYALVQGFDLFSSYDLLNAAASGLGHINNLPDPDGVSRREVLAVQYNDVFLPSLGLRAAQRYLNIRQNDFVLDGEDGVYLGTRHIPVEPFALSGAMVWGLKIVNFRGPYRSFEYHSAADILEQRFPTDAFKDKVVLIGATAPGLYDMITTPYSNIFPGVERHANVIDNILKNDFVSRPAAAEALAALLCLLVGLGVTFALPRMGFTSQVVSIAAFTILYSGICVLLFSSYGLWLNLTAPLLTLWLVSLSVMMSLFLMARREHRQAMAETFEASKMLGLAFQEKGMLEMAYEKYSKLPLDHESMDLLYNLGVELQRKRKNALAVTIFKKLYDRDPTYSDVVARLNGLGVVVKEPEDLEPDPTKITFIDESMPGTGDGLLKGGQTLGRYEVVKLLGKGNMGAVYLSKDPTIDRMVAIKTFQLADYVEQEYLVEWKQSFLKEAKLAGKLNHPNIVTIFDAGEDWDLSFIAMEVLEGVELKVHCQKDNLLPLPKTLKTVATVALALDYAHQNGVIHRDIKPANIMILNNGVLKITDFGIALVKGEVAKIAGTPAYMAPEQFGNLPVDGRTDLYALGVVFYELLTGQKPFTGQDFNELKEQILHAPVPDVRMLPGVPPALAPIIEKLLAKKKDDRFASGRELVTALQKLVGAKAKSSTAAKPQPKASANEYEATVVLDDSKDEQ